MGTPARNLLLSQKFISPLSPRLREPIKGSKSVITANDKLSVRKLDFQTALSPNKYSSSPVNLVVPSLYNTCEKSSKKGIVFNTPMRHKVSKDGLNQDNLLHIIGKGNFGRVVKGIFKDKVVAVKVLRRTESKLRDRNALDLNHPNVIKILDITEKPSENYCLIIMEYHTDSMHLQSYVENAEDPLDQRILPFAKAICSGLQYCHSRGILHLDVKPQNILVCGDICKLCDFGNSCRIDRTEEFENNGTIYYTAPELWQGMPPTEKCDIYSLGVVFWYMKHRKTPYAEYDNAEFVIYQVVKYCLRPDIDVPECEYASLYQSCWRKDPSARPSISELLDILENL